jgi:hypothetical protein
MSSSQRAANTRKIFIKLLSIHSGRIFAAFKFFHNSKQTTMENKRPSNTISLPIKGDAEHPVTCTVIQAKVKSIRAFREKTRKVNRNSNYERLRKERANALIAVDALRINLETGLDQDAYAKLQAEIAKGEAHLAEYDEKILAADEVDYREICERAFSIINVPNADDGTPRTFEDIDWDEADIEEVNRAVNFFKVKIGELPKSTTD